jgi:2-polyprenyl-3-methyl-5-hydroxy-6-metoxy-1,4-benzoquinol methylase
MTQHLAERPRTLAPEILDELPADAPEAVSSRRDLRLFNAALGNWRWMIARVQPLLRDGDDRVLELGAGTGELGRQANASGIAWDGLDRVPRPSAWPKAAQWHQADIFDFNRWEDYAVVVGSLVFHHFDESQLAALGQVLDSSRVRAIVVGDLRRGKLQLLLFNLYARLIGANRVSLHDGSLSVQAGFRRHELPNLLKLDPLRWSVTVERSQICAYRMIARRRT